MTGEEKRSYQLKRLEKLGAKRAKLKPLPLNVIVQNAVLRRENVKKEIEEARSAGSFHPTIFSRNSEGDSKQIKKFVKGRGLKVSKGSYKDGVLHVKKGFIRLMQKKLRK